jgi:hypothetical protein
MMEMGTEMRIIPIMIVILEKDMWTTIMTAMI